MKTFCNKCLYTSSHPLGIIIGDDGLCSGCRIHLEKDIIDWEEKHAKLEKITSEYKSKKRSLHDCIVPVSGGKDSFFIVHLVKNVLKLNPLLVTYNSQYNSPTGIRNLSKLTTVFGCDLIKLTLNPRSLGKINRLTFSKLNSVYWHVLAGETVFPIQMSVRFKIPLIIWGCHQGIDQVGMFSHHDSVEMTRRYRKDHDLMGFEPEDFLKENLLNEEDVFELLYPSDYELASCGTRGIYLNNFFRWDSLKQHEEMIKKYNFETRTLLNTFDNCNDTHCEIHNTVHDLIKLYKIGYSKITDHINREIRFGRIDKEGGRFLVDKYEKALSRMKIHKSFESILQIPIDHIKRKVESIKTQSNYPNENYSKKIQDVDEDSAFPIVNNPKYGNDDDRERPILLGRGWHD